jgi:oxygen-dependent protoporphyrinogen oxidase
LTTRIGERAGDRLACEARVERVRRGPPGASRFVLEGADRDGARRWDADAVVVALSAWDAAPLLSEIAPDAAQALGEIEAPPLAVVTLAWRRAEIVHPLDGFGFLVAREEPVSILGCLWPSSIFTERASDDGRVMMTSFVGGARDAARASLDDASMVEAVVGDLGRILGASGRPEVLAISRYERAIPQYTLGHGARIERLRASLSPLPGLAVCGNFVRGISLGECVRQGFDTAVAVHGMGK